MAAASKAPAELHNIPHPNLPFLPVDLLRDGRSLDFTQIQIQTQTHIQIQCTRLEEILQIKRQTWPEVESDIDGATPRQFESAVSQNEEQLDEKPLTTLQELKMMLESCRTIPIFVWTRRDRNWRKQN
ncbi:hypothetical protein B0H13DRAFT_1857347 [Mycena leptocephala]|nr:hypothetical protein B0H13DRAFT_1857347 [Mycena leptocephala]